MSGMKGEPHIAILSESKALTPFFFERWTSSLGSNRNPGHRFRNENSRRSSASIYHADIELGKVIVERHFKIFHKSQHGFFVISQAVLKFLGGLCLTRPRFPGGFSGAGLRARPYSTSWL
jgi:hypothetical protein